MAKGERGFKAVCCWKVDTAGSWIVGVNNPLSNEAPAMSYQQLTLEQREVISQMHYSGSGPTAAARRQLLVAWIVRRRRSAVDDQL